MSQRTDRPAGPTTCVFGHHGAANLTMMSAMARRFLARAVGPFLLVCLLGLILGLATWIANNAEPADQSGTAATAAEAFEEAYATFEDDFAAGDALAEDDATLVQLTASVRAVRLAFSDFDTTVAPLEMPASAAEDVAAMHAAIEDLIVKFDLQGATTTVSAYQEANPAAAAAYRTARAAITKVRATLRALSRPAASASASGSPDPAADLPEPGSLQAPVDAPYATPTRIANASQWRDALLAIGRANADTRYTDNVSLGIREGWVSAFPGILTENKIVAAAAEAPRSGISGFAVTTPDPALAPSRENRQYLAFAVRDNQGHCAGGVITGYPALTTTTPVNVARGQVCTGLAVAVAAGF